MFSAKIQSIPTGPRLKSLSVRLVREALKLNLSKNLVFCPNHKNINIFIYKIYPLLFFYQLPCNKRYNVFSYFKNIFILSFIHKKSISYVLLFSSARMCGLNIVILKVYFMTSLMIEVHISIWSFQLSCEEL